MVPPIGLMLLLLEEDEDDENELSDNRSLNETLDDLESDVAFDTWLTITALIALLLGIGLSFFFS